MRSLRSSLLVCLVTLICLGQSASDLVTPDIRRVGDKLACLCGRCNNTVATCQMLGCGYATPARLKIASLQKASTPDDKIVAEFVKDRGNEALALPPAEGFNLLVWVMPFVVLTAGLFAIWLYVRRFRKPLPQPQTAALTPDQMSRVRAQMEKDLAEFD